MNRFTIRVVLHNATFENYVDLAAKLASFGIPDIILPDDGNWYELPPAEYTLEANATPDQVRALAGQTAATVVPDYQIFVSQVQGNRVWQGLRLVNLEVANSPTARLRA